MSLQSSARPRPLARGAASAGRLAMACLLVVGLALAGRGLTVGSLAASLGDVVLRSQLGEPLDARVTIDGLGQAAAGDYRLLVGDVDDYAALDLLRPRLVDGLSIESLPGEADRFQLRTRQPVTDLVIDVVLVLAGVADRQVRYYPLLLDFPSAVDPPTIDRPSRAEPRAEPRAPARPRPEADVLPASGQRYGPVQRGQTLNGIASELAGEGEAVDELADALFQLNPDAFISGNRNQLIAGARLVLPARDEAAAEPRLAVPRRQPAEDRLRLRAPPDPESLVDALASWIDADDRGITANADLIERDLNFARSEIETYNRQNQALRTRIGNLEARIASLQRVMALQEELERQTRTEAASQAAIAAAPTSEGLIAPSPETQAVAFAGREQAPPADPMPAEDEAEAALATPYAAAPPSEEAASPETEQAESDGGQRRRGSGWGWFPWVAGVLLLILVGLALALRAQRRPAWRAVDGVPTRSYLPEDL